MNVSEILASVPDIIELIALFLMALTVLATLVVRITPSKSDDEKVAALAEKLMKAISYLPTIGINPRTKKLEEAYKELQEKQKQDDSQKAG